MSADLATKRDLKDLGKDLKLWLGTLMVVVGTLLFAALHYIPPARGAEAFDWDRYHARQDACLEKDRIAAACAQGYCDELAVRQAQRACSAFTGLRVRDGG